MQSFQCVSYLLVDWEEFPNGRWGNSSAATFGDIKDHHLFYLRSTMSKAERLAMWGKQLYGEEDVWKVFYNYITGSVTEDGELVSEHGSLTSLTVAAFILLIVMI